MRASFFSLSSSLSLPAWLRRAAISGLLENLFRPRSLISRPPKSLPNSLTVAGANRPSPRGSASFFPPVVSSDAMVGVPPFHNHLAGRKLQRRKVSRHYHPTGAVSGVDR